MLRSLAIAGLVAFASSVDAQRPVRIPVQVVEEKLVVRCDVSTRFRRIPANLFVEFDANAGLQLHNQAAAGIRSEFPDGSAVPITVHLPGMEMTVERREIGDDELLDDFTKWYSRELGENAVVGTIGAKLLEQYHAVIDLDAGFVELSPPRERAERLPEDVEGSTTLPITLSNRVVWIPARYGDGEPAAYGIGTSRWDSTVDRDLCWSTGAPDGDVGPVRLGDVNVTSYVPLRPADVHYVHTDGALGLTGLGLLHHFRVEIDRVNRWVRLTPTAPAAFADEERAFFEAEAHEDADAVAAFVAAHPDSRLTFEAANLLLDLHLIDGGWDGDAIVAALRAIDGNCIGDLRATSALEVMARCEAFGFPEHLVTAGEIGIEGGRDDRYPNAVHEIHAKLGRVLLDEDEDRRAWKHLLSAAFGLPEDGEINYHLGRYYEKQGRLNRAYSRYVQAVIRPESGPRALAALQRVQPLLGEEAFSVDVVERMIAGKVRSFGAASVYEPDAEHDVGRVVLVEFFTNAYLGDEVRGAIGGALGNEGLLDHFEPESVAFLSYHLPEPSPDPLVNELSEMRATSMNLDAPVYHVVDGQARGPGAGRFRDAEGIYNAVRGAILSRLTQPTDYELECEAVLEDGVLRGTLRGYGPARSGLQMELIVAEGGVLFPGSSQVVVHRMLARGSALPSIAGVDYDPADGVHEVEFERDLADLARENEEFLDALERRGIGTVPRMSGTIDPEQVWLVAVMRHAYSQEVVQALQIQPLLEGREEGP